MLRNFLVRLPLFFILIMCVLVASAQDSIPRIILIDSAELSVFQLRPFQEKPRLIPRGIKLANSKASLKPAAFNLALRRRRLPSFWESKNKLGFNVSEVAFVNWNAGGNNAVSALADLKFERNYKFRYIQWDNYMDLRYGLNLQENQKLRKTDDAIRLSSTFGYRRDTISNWFYSVKANFNTQFSNGFKYPDRETPISRFMAPGYSFLGAGTSYITRNQKFNLYISPFTQKTTFVFDQNLADKGAFGVQKAIRDTDGNIIEQGENIFLEFGFLITNSWEAILFENINLKHRLSLYTDYLRRFGNIDVDWELNVEFRINRYIATTIGTQLIYDDDILFNEQKDDNGNITDPGEPKLQFRQLLGVGVSYAF